jgi:hypothetical protein
MTFPFPIFSPSFEIDPYFSSVVFLSHFDGADGSTTFIDQKSHTIAANGNAQLDTADFKFASASLLLDGTGDHASVAGTADFNLNGDLTVEGWAKTSAATNANEVIFTLSTAAADGDGPAIILYSRHSGVTNSGPRLRTTTGAGGAGLTTIDHGTSMVGAGFYHWAVTRSGTTLRFFIGGTLVGSATPSWPAFASPALTIGAQGSTGGNNFTGWLDDVRITKDVARYTANFTPPTSPHPDQ